jgi:TatD DNase family protein
MLDDKNAASTRDRSGLRPDNPPSLSQSGLFDAHCHLQDERFGAAIDPVLRRAREKNVAMMMCCGCRESDWGSVLGLSEKKGVLVSFGLHPWFVGERSAGWCERLRELLLAVPHAGVGEIGLDTKVEATDPVAQEEAFIRQIRLARELLRPVSIHCRGAFGRMIELLEKEGGMQSGGLIHSYSGPRELVPVFEGLGLSISFSGSITHPKNKRGRQAIGAVSPDRLLIETDSPDMPPEGVGPGVLNEPAYLPLVLSTVASLIGSSEEETAMVTRENAKRLFGIID